MFHKVSFSRCRYGGINVGQKCLLWRNCVVRHKHVGRLVIVAAKGEYYECKKCGKREFKQFFKCPHCSQQNSMVLKLEESKKGGQNGGGGAGSELVQQINNNQSGYVSAEAQELDDLISGTWTSSSNSGELRSTKAMKNTNFTPDETRIKIPGAVGEQVNAVLGGGIVPGSAILISGEPGIGKSTLLLQIAGLLAQGWQGQQSAYMKAEGFDDCSENDPKVLYSSAEENQFQVNSRAERCGFGNLDTLVLQHQSNLKQLFEDGLKINPSVIIIDSISTIQISGLDASVGGVSQVKESANAICKIAKDRCIPIFTVCHVTKDGNLSGPKQLQHRVDVVLEMCNLTNDGIIALRARKNRFGSTENMALFKMEGTGLTVVDDANTELLRNWREVEGSGSVVTVIKEGNHQLMVEIQAMGVMEEAQQSDSSKKKRGGSGGGVVSYTGLDRNNVYKMMGVLQCRTGYKPFKYAWHYYIKGGLRIRDPAMDLALAMAMVSFLRQMPMPRDLVVIGEVGLLGEISHVAHLKQRLITAAKQGFKKAVICNTYQNLGNIEGMEVVKCKKIQQAFYEVFGKQIKQDAAAGQPELSEEEEEEEEESEEEME